MGNIVRNERGVALMMVLVISAVVLVVTTAMIYMLTTGTKISGIKKRHESALEAAMGCEGVMRALIGQRGDASELGGLNMTITSTNCMDLKLTKAKGEWESSCDSSYIIDQDDASTYDISADLGSHMCYAKITHTGEGNSGKAGGGSLKKLGVVADDTAGGSVVHYEYDYSIELMAVNKSNTNEKAKLSMLYLY
jgi:hypothetical protein